MIQSQPLNNGQVKLVVQAAKLKPRFFRERYYDRVHTTMGDVVILDDLPEGKNIVAPFVSPHSPGTPSRARGSESRAISVGTIRLNDPIDPFRKKMTRGSDPFSMMAENPATLLPMMRRDTIIEQKDKVDNAFEYMCAKLTIDGYYTVYGDGVPTLDVDFQRDPNLTVVLEEGARWGDKGVSIIRSINKLIRLMKDAARGGNPKTALVGKNVADVLSRAARKGGELNELLMNDYTVDSDFVRGLRSAEAMVYLGRLSKMIDVIEYTETFTIMNSEGVEEKVCPLGDDEIVLIAEDIGGYMAFGSIKDRNASYQPIPVFTQNYVTVTTPSREVVTTDSSPAAILGYPNRTLKATVTNGPIADIEADPEV